METLFLYFVKVILGSAVLFLYYRLFLKDKTFHHYNRFYLLAAMMISLLLPLIRVSYFTLAVNSDMYLLVNKLQHFKANKILSNDLFYFKITAFGFGLVSVFFLTRLFFGIIKIELLKKQFKKENFQGISFYQTNLENAPFSFFRNLFWKDSIELQSDIGRQILKHEMVHIEQKHSWDKMIMEIANSLFWFNPFFYLIKKEINLIHEYLADNKAVKNSDTKAFAQMLLASHFSGKMLPATSPFLSSNLKKRLTMLKKSKTKFSYARKILALPLLFTLAFIYLVNAKNKEIEGTNLQIQKYAAAMQLDTLTTPAFPEAPNPPAPPAPEENLVQLQQEIDQKEKDLQPLHDLLSSKNDEVKKISDKMKAKSDELEKLSKNKKFDSPQFNSLQNELSALGDQIDKIYNTSGFQNQMKLQDKNYAELDQLYAKMDAFYNSDDFKNKIKDAENQAKNAEKLVNSPKFRKQIADAEKEGKKAEKSVNSPKFKKRIADAEKKGAEAGKLVNSAEFQQHIKDAETAAKSAQIALRDSQVALKNSQISLNDSKNSSLNINADSNIFIDGKPSTKKEMEKLDPNKIESVNVFKKGFNGKKKGEIYIKLKK